MGLAQACAWKAKSPRQGGSGALSLLHLPPGPLASWEHSPPSTGSDAAVGATAGGATGTGNLLLLSLSHKTPPYAAFFLLGNFFFSYWPRPGVWEELRELGVSIFILSPLPPSPSTSFLTFCILPRLPGSSQKRAACPAWREREGGGSQGRLPEPWCPRPQPARSLLPGARPRPAAPVFSSGLIACQDLPNVSCSVSIFKRTPEAIFKQEGWGPMLMRGACSELTALPATSPAGVLGACTADPPPPSHTLWAWPAPGFIFKPGQTRALPRAKVYTHRLPLLGSSKLPGRDRSCHRYSLEPSMGPDREEGRVNICSSCARVSLLRCLTEASADGDASSLTPTSGWGVML